MKLRAERAGLLGYDSHAAYVTSDETAGSPEAVHDLLRRLAVPAARNASREQAALQAIVDAEPEPFALEAHDWAFYTEKVRAAEYDLDRGALRPWFEAERVLQEGVFHAATELYGVTFAEREDLGAYHPDARVFEVSNADGVAGRTLRARSVHPRHQARRRVDELDRLAVPTPRDAADRREQPQRSQARRGQADTPHAATRSPPCSTSSATRSTGCSRP